MNSRLETLMSFIFLLYSNVTVTGSLGVDKPLFTQSDSVMDLNMLTGKMGMQRYWLLWYFMDSTLADPGGGRVPGTPTPRFGGPSVQFKSKRMNFRALILYFFQKFFSLTSLDINLLFLSHSSSLTLLIISYIFHFLICILLHYMDSTNNLSCL